MKYEVIVTCSAMIACLSVRTYIRLSWNQRTYPVHCVMFVEMLVSSLTVCCIIQRDCHHDRSDPLTDFAAVDTDTNAFT